MSFAAAIWAAALYGVYTSISPCPMATNIAAVSYIGKQVSTRKLAILSGLFYSLGRVVAYVGLASILTTGLLSTPIVSEFLQKYLNLFLGPVLIFVGLFLLGWLGGKISFSVGGEKLHKRLAAGGIVSSALLGILFALSFCPISAALFFLQLVPLAVEQKSPVLLPLVYGLGTGLPVLIFALLIALATNYVGKTFHVLTKIEKWSRRIAAGVFIIAGIYLSLIYTFNIAG